MAKKYYWLKLKKDFFNQKEIKKLRRIAGGDTYTIIYLKMQLLTLQDEGILKYEGTEENLAEQLALQIDEDVDNIQVTLNFLIKNRLIEEVDTDSYLLPGTVECIGREGQSAERVRKFRQNKKNEEQKTLQCNTTVTNSNTEIEKEIEKEIEIEKDKELRINTKVFIEKWNSLGLNKLINIKNKRLQSLKARVDEYGEENVLKAIDNINKSDFLKGTNDRGWIIDFDWLLRPNNFIKVLENRYKNNVPSVPQERTQKASGFNNFEARQYDYDDLERKLLGWDKDDGSKEN